jgi:hypothetical protein
LKKVPLWSRPGGIWPLAGKQPIVVKPIVVDIYTYIYIKRIQFIQNIKKIQGSWFRVGGVVYTSYEHGAFGDGGIGFTHPKLQPLQPLIPRSLATLTTCRPAMFLNSVKYGGWTTQMAQQMNVVNPCFSGISEHVSP